MPPIIATLWASIKAAKMAITLAVIGTLLLLLAVQTVRIEGIRIWPINVDGMKAKVARAEAAEIAARAAYKAEARRRATIGTEYEREAANDRAVATIREREITTIYRDIPVPAECAVPDDVRRVLAEAVAASNSSTTGQLGGELLDPADAPEPAH